MGRNVKQGFNYFSLDVDIFSDIKIRKLIKNHSGRALSVYICVLAFIYRNGYYVLNDEDFGFIVSEQTGDKVEFIEAVLDYCVKVGLFSAEMFEQGVYTSKGVQERYLAMCKASRRNIVFSEYTLISSEEMGINSEEIAINSEKTPIKKSKVNNISLLEKEKQKSVCVEFGEGEKKEQPLNAEKETSPQVAPAPPPFNFRKAMLSEGFTPELVDEWLKIRKAKKAVNTERAFKAFVNQVQQTNQDMNSVLEIVVQKQWKGFEADWLHNTQAPHLIANNQITLDENGNIITNGQQQQSTSDKQQYYVGRQTADNIRNNMQGWGTHTFGDS
ncbi:DUF4373 domain-containing protein [Capnocytophaga sputigena]|uniref:DUF4373 domain-containing protein n=1 Tax=Capnocytophaga sputigena TaxID=1019 RepID=UPI0028E51865|nr:DUF4373 domain-containing protein [Capnocytophaga sputigena]